MLGSSTNLRQEMDIYPQGVTVIGRENHILSHRSIPKGALAIVDVLKREGFSAYLVGGCVRDLLLGRKPKDFDIATDAHPVQIKRLFKFCHLVGKRFQIARVRQGREIFEVSTFRAAHTESNEKAQSSEEGLLLRDNVFGNLEQDVWRRDFTVNALYYDSVEQSILDYTGGLLDLHNNRLCIIGDPAERYREDPARMLRAVRLSAKLDFIIEEETECFVIKLSHLLADVAAARLFLEVEKLFLQGHALRSYELLVHYRMFGLLFSQTEKQITLEPLQEALLRLLFVNTDQRVVEKKPVTMHFLLAALLWPSVQALRQAYRKVDKKTRSLELLRLAADEVLRLQSEQTSISRRIALRVREIWELQLSLMNRRRANKLVQNPTFRAAYDLLLLRVVTEPELKDVATWWTEFQHES